jgi:hypothetical protein
MKVAGCTHWAVCNVIGLQVTHKYYERISERVMHVNGTAVMWYVLKTKTPSKYKGLTIEGSRMWKVRAEIVPVISGALETIKKELDRNLQLPVDNPAAVERRSSH